MSKVAILTSWSLNTMYVAVGLYCSDGDVRIELKRGLGTLLNLHHPMLAAIGLVKRVHRWVGCIY